MDQKSEPCLVSAPTKAILWLRQNELQSGGILTHSQYHKAYQEVTGYLIPTLLSVGESELANRCANWLVKVQQSDGGFVDPRYNREYVFDTAQCLRGLLAIHSNVTGADQAALKASEFMISRLVDGGRSGFQPEYSDTSLIEETIHLNALPHLMEAASHYRRAEFKVAAENVLEYYLQQDNLLNLSNRTHFLMYKVEALLDLDLKDMVLSLLGKLAQLQKPDGSVHERDAGAWVCVPGLAQLALCWYRVGQWEVADRAMDWLDQHQEADGGFLGSYGEGANYFIGAEIPWAAKYYLDAHIWRVKTHFDRRLAEFPDTVSSDDGRLIAILKHIKSRNRVLEVGCGKGRFLKRIKETWPDTKCVGIDPSRAIEIIPSNIISQIGTLEVVPYPDKNFDVVLAVEALEHAINPEKAVKEMVRVTRPGGWIIIIDKQRSAWGRLVCPSWEVWPDRRELLDQLAALGVEATAENIAYNNGPASDNLMICWSGRK